MVNHRNAINLNFNYFFASILEPFLKDVIRNLVLNTKRMERFSTRQSLRLVLKVKPFKIFTAIHNSIIGLAAKIELSINSHFLTAYTTYLSKRDMLHVNDNTSL